MKKILALVCSIAMMTMLLAGCGGNSNGGNEQPSGNEGGETAGIAAENIKVGVIHIGDPATGSGYTYTDHRKYDKHDKGASFFLRFFHRLTEIPIR